MKTLRNFRYYSRRLKICYDGAVKVMPFVWKRNAAFGDVGYLVDVFGLFKFSFSLRDKKTYRKYLRLCEMDVNRMEKTREKAENIQFGCFAYPGGSTT